MKLFKTNIKRKKIQAILKLKLSVLEPVHKGSQEILKRK